MKQLKSTYFFLHFFYHSGNVVMNNHVLSFELICIRDCCEFSKNVNSSSSLTNCEFFHINKFNWAMHKNQFLFYFFRESRPKWSYNNFVKCIEAAITDIVISADENLIINAHQSVFREWNAIKNSICWCK